jgi:hypothetical protein
MDDASLPAVAWQAGLRLSVRVVFDDLVIEKREILCVFAPWREENL